MSWIVIIAEDLNDYLVADQVEAIRTAALGDGQTDRFAAVMPAVASRIRAEIQAGDQEVSATANSIPDSLKMTACLLIIEAIQGGIPGLSLTEDQRTMIRDAREYLKRIASGEIKVEMPGDAAPNNTQSAGGAQVVSSTTRRMTRDTLGGL